MGTDWVSIIFPNAFFIKAASRLSLRMTQGSCLGCIELLQVNTKAKCNEIPKAIVKTIPA